LAVCRVFGRGVINLESMLKLILEKRYIFDILYNDPADEYNFICVRMDTFDVFFQTVCLKNVPVRI